MTRPNVTLQMETAEAICSALHRVHFDDGSDIFSFLGDSNEGASSWFLMDRGRVQKVRIEVVRSRLANVVHANVEFPNVAQGFKVGRIVLTIDTDDRAKAIEGSAIVVTRIFEIARDVVSGQGVASKAALSTPETSNDDVDGE